VKAALLVAAAAWASFAMPVQAEQRDDYARAVAARQAGDAATAIALLEPLVVADAGNADAWLQLGLAYLAADRPDDAERAFRRTLSIAPGYADARIGLARVEQRRGDRASARAILRDVDPGNAEAAALGRQLSALPEATWRADLDTNYSALGGGQRDWKEAALGLSHRRGGTTIGARVEWMERFGLEDVFGELRVDRSLGERATAYVAAGGTPGADFRPEWQIGLGGSLRVRDGGNATVLTIDARQSRYRIGDIQTVSPGIEQYLGDGRYWLTARWINIFDDRGVHRMGYLLRGDAQAGAALRLFAGLADAPDPDQGVVAETFTLFGGAALRLTDSVELRASAARENRDIGADRTQVSLGLGWRF
jgi:YaiO family outer membrane protein